MEKDMDRTEEDLALRAEHISFSYGKRGILKDVSFSVRRGEVLVITGENGSGKSTLLSILAGAVRPDSGCVTAAGRIGLVPQGNSVFEDMTVRENICFFAGLAKRKVPSHFPLGLDPYARVKASKLSGGYLKRLNVACTLVMAPQIWLFDEPCANLDARWREEMIRMVKSCKMRGCAICYVGHDPAEYESFCDQVLYLEGRAF